jgi:hypothetical protein
MDWLASLFISSGVSFTPGAVATVKSAGSDFYVTTM